MNHDHVKHIADISSLAVAMATVAQWLPPIAAIFSIVWSTMQMIGWIKRKGWKNGN